MSAPSPTHYDLIGGDAGIRRLVDRFYDLMDTAPEAATIRRLHATSLKASREKLRLFLTVAAVTVGVATARDFFGETGVFVVAAISGLTDVDAITLSTARLVACSASTRETPEIASSS